ncbi:MAG TPA: sigma-70 family RNA polymerase sigma factor [Steroidobacteraceae bacterium]|nr:sigma-70 family RNA polymerase sigma factor [Steroidobacteraceae bacterium]
MNADSTEDCAATWADVRAGDAAAFARWVRDHQRMVYSLGLRMLRNREAAEDLTQEVFMQLHERIGTLDTGTHARHWLRRVAMHRAIDQLRRRPPASTGDDVLSLVDERDAVDHLLANRLRVLVGELPPHPRAVVVLRYQEDLDPAEICQLLEMPLNTVKSHLRRALEVLRERLS